MAAFDLDDAPGGVGSPGPRRRGRERLTHRRQLPLSALALRKDHCGERNQGANGGCTEQPDAELAGAELAGAELTGAELTGAELTGAELRLTAHHQSAGRRGAAAHGRKSGQQRRCA